MLFISDLAGDRPYVALAIGTVEDGWTGVIDELFEALDGAAASAPDMTLDICSMGERDGSLFCDIVVDPTDAAASRTVANAVASAVALSEKVCARCGKPGRLRRDRAGWPVTRCDTHTPEARR